MEYIIGDRVVITKLMLNSRSAGVTIGDKGTVASKFYDGYMGKDGALVRLDKFSDCIPESMVSDLEFDIEKLTYQFFDEEFEII